MHLTQFSDYSLRILVFLVQNPNRLATIDEISEYFKISRNHLVKVVHNLSVHGLIKTHRGNKGGIALARDPKDYLIGDIVRLTEPDLDFVECFNRQTNKCPLAGGCRLEDVFHNASQAFFESLNKYTLEAAASCRALAIHSDNVTELYATTK